MTTHKSLNMPLSYIELLFRRAYPLCLLYMEGQSLYMPWWSLACCTAHCLLMIFAMSSPCPMLTCVPVFHRILVMLWPTTTYGCYLLHWFHLLCLLCLSLLHWFQCLCLLCLRDACILWMSTKSNDPLPSGLPRARAWVPSPVLTSQTCMFAHA